MDFLSRFFALTLAGLVVGLVMLFGMRGCIRQEIEKFKADAEAEMKAAREKR
jgi:hypothetical protein